MGLLDNNSVAILTKDGSFSASSTFNLNDTGNIVSIDITKKRNKVLMLKLTFSGISRDSRFRLRLNPTAIFYAEDGRIFRQLTYGKEVWDLTREEYTVTLLLPCSNVKADNLVFRNDYAAGSGATLSYSYVFVDPRPLDKPIQFLGDVAISPTGTGTFGDTFTPTASARGTVDLKWFKYFFVKCIVVKPDGTARTGTNYNLLIQRSVFLENTGITVVGGELVAEEATGAVVSDFLPMTADRGLRADVTVNTYVADTRYIVEFYGVR